VAKATSTRAARPAHAGRVSALPATRRGKASWSGDVVAFDEAAAEVDRAVHGDGDSVMSNRGSGSHGAVAKGARGYVACSIRG